MSWKSWVPYHGDYATRKKLRELDKAGVGIPMFIVLMLQKSFELLINNLGGDLPIPVWLTFLLAAAATFVLWVYDHQIREKLKKPNKKSGNKFLKVCPKSLSMGDRLFWSCCILYFLSLYGVIHVDPWFAVALFIFFFLIPATFGESETPDLLKTQLKTLNEVRKN